MLERLAQRRREGTTWTRGYRLSGRKIASPEGKALDKLISGQDIETDPSEAQKESGNYKKGKIRLHGLNISIENPKGATRSGVSDDGKEWSSKMKHHYGYIKRTEARDGDHLDVFIGPCPDSDKVFIVNQKLKGKFDEHKVMLGFKTKEEAEKGYLANYDKGWDGLGSIHELSVSEFKDWLKNGNTKKEFKPSMKKTASLEYLLLKYGIDFDEESAASRTLEDVIPLAAFPGVDPRYVFATVRIGPSAIQGNGVMAKRFIHKDELVFPAMLDGHRTIFSRYINHSEYPNVDIVGNLSLMAFRASRDISSGEEITVDYEPYFRMLGYKPGNVDLERKLRDRFPR